MTQCLYINDLCFKLIHLLLICAILLIHFSTSSCFITHSPLERIQITSYNNAVGIKLQSSNKPTLFTNLNPKFDAIVESRYACTRFHRHDGTISTLGSGASTSNSEIVDIAFECLNLARISPSGFNAQPYRLLLVHEKSQKEKVSRYCLGRNADRVRDSDCTILFLADKECLREYKRFGNFLDKSGSNGTNDSKGTAMKSKTLSKWGKRKMQFFILLFSSGWPLPRLISNPISFCMRLGVSAVSVITRRKILVPSLGSSETWASKNTMLVAMTYMLACSSRGLATCPMEGFNVGGIRKELRIPRRFAIPLIVSTGLPYQKEMEEEGFDDVGMEHGPRNGNSRSTQRYPIEEVIYRNEFGSNTNLS